jgi:hypothetical protein
MNGGKPLGMFPVSHVKHLDNTFKNKGRFLKRTLPRQSAKQKISVGGLQLLSCLPDVDASVASELLQTVSLFLKDFLYVLEAVCLCCRSRGDPTAAHRLTGWLAACILTNMYSESKPSSNQDVATQLVSQM